MLVLAAVPDAQLHKLRRAGAMRFALAHARTWNDALATIRTRPVELAVVDPLLAEEARSASRQLRERLAWVLAPLPSELRWVLEEVLRSPAELQTVQQVAARARLDRRTFERWFLRLGLPSPRHFLAATRVLHAHRLLQDPGFTVDDVAQRLGYAQTKTLQLHARAYLGLTAGEMRLTLEPRQALERIAQGFVPPRQAQATAS